MTNLADLFPLDDLYVEIDAGYVQTRQHPTEPLTIYTYTRHCQYDRRWNDVTMRCRGLIAHDNGMVVAWPFPKFFNVSEHNTGQPYAPPLPDEPFSIFEKVDGSLGIVFWWHDKWHVASKGSFTSDQAQWAQKWLDDRDTSRLEVGITYLCEIVYPENRIVVRYDDSLTGLCLLGAYDAQGRELPLHEFYDDWAPIGYNVRQWSARDRFPMSLLMSLADGNKGLNGEDVSGSESEGWVIRFQESGIRAKIKFAEYVRLHKVLTGINARDIWQAYGADRFHDIDPRELAKTIGVPVSEAERMASIEGGAIRPLIDDVPDEFDQWVRDVMASLDRQYYELYGKIAECYDNTIAAARADNVRTDHRKNFAEHATNATTDPIIRAALFRKFDRKDIGPHVWKALRPAATDPFRTDTNEEA